MKKIVCAALVFSLLFASCATSGQSIKTLTRITTITGGGLVAGSLGYAFIYSYDMKDMMNYMFVDKIGQSMMISGLSILSIGFLGMVFQLFDYSDRYW